MDVPIQRKFSWTAVFVGAIAGLGINFLLDLIILAIGLSIFSEKSANLISFSVMGLIGFLLVAILSMFTAGWLAGRLSENNILEKNWGILYGFIAWCLSFIMTVILLTNMLQFSYFHSSFTSNQLTGVRISNQGPMLTETKADNADVDKKMITLNATITLLLFLTGAVSSCVGGYVGFNSRKKNKNT